VGRKARNGDENPRKAQETAKGMESKLNRESVWLKGWAGGVVAVVGDACKSANPLALGAHEDESP